MTTRRPGALTAIAVIALSLGFLGACTGILGIGGTLVQGPLQESQRSLLEGSGMPQHQIDAQLAAQDEMQRVTRKWMPLSLTHASLNVIASTLLLVAGILLLRMTPAARPLFLAAMGLNVLVDVGGGIIGALMQHEMQEVMAAMMTTASRQGANPQFDRMFEGIMRASTWTGVCFAIVWVLAKLGYYLWGVLYLRKPHVRALLGKL